MDDPQESRRQLRRNVLDRIGTVDFDPAYDHKAARRPRSPVPVAMEKLTDALADDLDALRAADRYRTCRTWTRRDARTVVLDGRSLLNVSTNDYLGLAHDPRVVEAAVTAARHYGWGGAASRLVVGQAPPYDDLERTLAEHKQAEAALVFSSGYHANLGLVTALVGQGDLVVTDELNHASLWDAAKLSRAKLRVFRHADAEDLARVLRLPGRYGRRLVLSDGIFSMDGDTAPLPELLAVCERHGAVLLVDDAHGYGVLGPRGAGTAASFGLGADRVLSIGTLSKAVGSLGGYVAGSAVLREALIQKARALIYTTALPPAVAAAAAAAVRLLPSLEDARAALLVRAARLREGLRALGYDTGGSATQIVPVVVGSDAAALRWMEHLVEREILAVAIRPPTVPEGTARLRLSLSAAHTDADVDRLLEAFAEPPA